MGENKHTTFMNEVPIVLSLGVMCVLNIYTWICIVGLLKNLMPATLDDNSIYVALNTNNNSNADTEAASSVRFGCIKTFYIVNKIKCYIAAANRLDPVGSRTIFRLVCTPLLYILILIFPSLICAYSNMDRIGYTVSVCSLVSGCTINFITWVLCDSQARGEWHRVNIEKVREVGRDSQSSYGTHPPSIYDDDEDVDAWTTTNALTNQLTNDCLPNSLNNSVNNSVNNPTDTNQMSKLLTHSNISEDSCGQSVNVGP